MQQRDTGIHYVYFIQCKPRGAVKIGVASDPEARRKTLQTANQKKLAVIAQFPCGSRQAAEELERWLHDELDYHRMNGEWFHRRILKRLRTGAQRVVGGEYSDPQQNFHTIDTSNTQCGRPKHRRKPHHKRNQEALAARGG